MSNNIQIKNKREKIDFVYMWLNTNWEHLLQTRNDLSALMSQNK